MSPMLNQDKKAPHHLRVRWGFWGLCGGGFLLGWLLFKGAFSGCGPAPKAAIPSCPEGQYYSSEAGRCVTPE